MLIPHYPDLENKKVFITGATRGIGRSLALELAKQKAHIFYNYRGGQEAAVKLQEEVIALGGKANFVEFDLSDKNKITESLTQLVKDFGPMEALVNNAGISKDQLLLRVKEEDLDQILDINLKGAIWVTKVLTRSFLKAENVSVVNMSSIVGLMGNTAQSLYAASKAGLIGFTKSYAKEMASKNIRSNALCPGFIETEMTEQLTESAKEYYLANIPLKRMGSSQEISGAILFLLSQASSYITGEVIKIDGGLYI